MVCNEIILSERFRQLGRTASAADSFLVRCSTVHILDQFRSRSILRFKFSRAVCGEGLSNDDEGFILHIGECEGIRDQARGIGLGIAETFHYNITFCPPRSTLDTRFVQSIHVFYEAFADMWLGRVDVEKVISDLHSEVDLKSDGHKKTTKIIS